MNVGEGHESAARAGVDPGPGLETDLGTIQETDLGPIQETIPGAKQEPTAKAAPTLISKVCIPHLWTNPLIEG